MKLDTKLWCQVVNRHTPPNRTALNLRSPSPWGPDTGKVQETERLARFTAMDALYQGPRVIGSPIALATCLFWVAFSIAWLQQQEQQKQLAQAIHSPLLGKQQKKANLWAARARMLQIPRAADREIKNYTQSDTNLWRRTLKVQRIGARSGDLRCIWIPRPVNTGRSYRERDER